MLRMVIFILANSTIFNPLQYYVIYHQLSYITDALAYTTVIILSSILMGIITHRIYIQLFKYQAARTCSQWLHNNVYKTLKQAERTCNRVIRYSDIKLALGLINAKAPSQEGAF